MDLFRAYTIERAVAALREHIAPVSESETVGLREAFGRILAEDVTAADDVPGFDRATMDGFAVRARDTFGASEGLPAYLQVTGEVLMGHPPAGELAPGQAFRIATGGMLPDGADAVVMVEYTEDLDGMTIGVTRPVAPGENTVRRGDDIAAGEKLLSAGRRLRAQDVGLLAAAGVARVPVRRRLRVGIITTGDEVIRVEESPEPGQVRDVNSYTTQGMVLEYGAEPVLYGIIKDDYASLAAAVGRALRETDLVVVTGGSSVGTRDVTARVLNELGEPGIIFHGLAVRPGKPTIGAVIGGRPVLGLPGHPVSAMIVFRLIGAPLLGGDGLMAALRARLTRSLHSQVGKEDYVRVRLIRDGRGEWQADPVLGKSGLIATMVRADGLARIPLEHEGAEAGEIVEVIPF
ncbi:MAG: molybdopterin molybdotransferase MoeA [Bacillota bacterium]|nr:molybdopterin molybdotransferase MoeA [Bacillota bacterium]